MSAALTLSEPWGLASLTDAERLAWAKAARPGAESWAIKSDLIGNRSTADRAARELQYIDLLITNDGALPTSEQCQ